MTDSAVRVMLADGPWDMVTLPLGEDSMDGPVRAESVSFDAMADGSRIFESKGLAAAVTDARIAAGRWR